MTHRPLATPRQTRSSIYTMAGSVSKAPSCPWHLAWENGMGERHGRKSQTDAARNNNSWPLFPRSTRYGPSLPNLTAALARNQPLSPSTDKYPPISSPRPPPISRSRPPPHPSTHSSSSQPPQNKSVGTASSAPARARSSPRDPGTAPRQIPFLRSKRSWQNMLSHTCLACSCRR